MSKWAIQVTWDDVPHLSAEAKAALLESIPLNQRDARTKGVPQLGSGVVYPIPEEDLICDPIEIPIWYRKVYALDVGWNRTAALWGAIDPEEDVLYLYSEHYRGQAEPSVHASAIKARGDWIPGVIDPAAQGSSQKDGEQLMAVYQSEGLHLSVADHSIEAGILEVWQRMSSQRIKIFSTLHNLRSELRLYRRDETGKIVKEGDHLMDCLRYLVRSGIARAAQVPAGRWGSMVHKPKYQSEYDASGSLYGKLN